MKAQFKAVEELTQFRDVIRVMSADKKLNGEPLNNRMIAEEADCSTSTLSLVGIGERSLSEELSNTLSRLLGGSPASWQKTYKITKSGTRKSAQELADIIKGQDKSSKQIGRQFKRLGKEDILVFLLEMRKNPRIEGQHFDIGDFDETMVQLTSYDTRIGAVVDMETGQRTPLKSVFPLKPGATVLAKTKESFTLPLWMEAEVGSPTSLAKKGLIVSCGPIIDPGFDGFLVAAIFNPLSKAVELSVEDVFLTVRFSVDQQG